MTIGDCRGKVSMFMPVSGDGIHSMAISPHDKALVAVGYRSGVLCLVDAAKGTVRHRLAGHDQEVQCVAWKATLKSTTPWKEMRKTSVNLIRLVEMYGLHRRLGIKLSRCGSLHRLQLKNPPWIKCCDFQQESRGCRLPRQNNYGYLWRGR